MAQSTGNAITPAQVATASRELEGMKRSLASWLKYRQMNDAVAAGTRQGRLPPGIAKQAIMRTRDMAVEQELATRLATLLTELGVKNLPNSDVTQNPAAAVQLAQIAIAGNSPALGGFFTAANASHPWLWPVLIVGALLLGLTTAIKTAADVAKEREHYACIQAGACTDYGFWLKAGGATVLAWFAWKELGVGDVVRGLIKKGRS
jgi:hypothetical protein